MTQDASTTVLDTAPIYRTTTATRPQIVCPSWCKTPEAEHIADLPNWDGMSVHSSGSIVVGGVHMFVGNSTTTDGAEDETVRFSFGGNTTGDDVTLDEAEAALQAALVLIEEARRAATVVRTPTVA